MRHWALLAATCLVAACSLNPGTGTKVRATTPPKKAASVAPSPALSAHKAIVEAIQGTLAACEVGRGQSAVDLLGDDGLGIISDNGLGVISNNGAGIISNNGSGIISDNGLGIISDNGLGYRVLASSPLPSDSPYFAERVSSVLGLMWHGRVYKPDFHGEVIGYMPADYEAKGDEAPVVERYEWDQPKVDFDPVSLLAPPIVVKMTYQLKPVVSQRFQSMKAATAYLTLAVNDFKKLEKPIYKDFSCDYTLVLSFPDAPDEQITMKGYDYTYKKGFGLGRQDFSSPRSFKARGESPLGKLEMVVVKEDTEGADQHPASVTATRIGTDGKKATVELTLKSDRTQRSVVTDVSAGVEAVMDFDAQRKGAGVVRTKADQKPLGTIAWNDKGIGTITFTDGATETVRVF